MKLSSEAFRELAHAMTGNKLEAGKERRRSGRVKVEARVPLSLILKGEHLPPAPIIVRDVSPRGINILYPQFLPGGQQFTVQLSSGPKAVTLLCTVMHSQLLANGLYSVGAEFTCVLPVARPAADGTTEKRIRESMLE